MQEVDTKNSIKERILYLRKRLEEGDEYLAKNPNNQKAIAGYWRYWDEYTRLGMVDEIRASLTAVTLSLPTGLTWQKNEDAPPCQTVRVMMHSAPAADDEMTIDALSDLNETMALLAEGLR